MLRNLVFALVFVIATVAVYVALRHVFTPGPERNRGPAFMARRSEGEKRRGGSRAGGLPGTLTGAGSGVAEIRDPVNGAVVATIAGSSFEGCGVLTCDYDEKDPEYPDFIDHENTWERGTNFGDISLPGTPDVAVSAAARHFGRRGLEVTNAFGPSRNFRLEQGRDYLFSAWVKRASGAVPFERGAIMDVDYRRQARGSRDWPVAVALETRACTGELTARSSRGGWWYVEMSVPASKDLTRAMWNAGWRCARVWVGVPQGDGAGGDATVYIDDIRFRPAGSRVCSFYYDWNTVKREACVGPDNAAMPCGETDRCADRLSADAYPLVDSTRPNK